MLHAARPESRRPLIQNGFVFAETGSPAVGLKDICSCSRRRFAIDNTVCARAEVATLSSELKGS